MSKPAAILLTVALELGILFAGQAQTQEVIQQSPISAGILAPLSASGSLHSNSPGVNHLPAVPDISLFDFLYGYTAALYWTRPTQNQKQITALFRSGHGVKSTGSRSGEIASSGRHPPAAADISFHLYSLSPPGLILRL